MRRLGGFPESFLLLLGALSLVCLGLALGSPGCNCASIGALECDLDHPCTTGVCRSGRCFPGRCVDNDGDGYGVGPTCTLRDCDDTNAAINPSMNEICGDGIDNNCNGAIDEGCPCVDASGNPVPAGSTRPCGLGICAGTQTCTSGALWGSCLGGQMPLAYEICGNGLDDNCNGQQDEGCCGASEFLCDGGVVCSSNGMCR